MATLVGLQRDGFERFLTRVVQRPKRVEGGDAEEFAGHFACAAQNHFAATLFHKFVTPEQ